MTQKCRFATLHQPHSPDSVASGTPDEDCAYATAHIFKFKNIKMAEGEGFEPPKPFSPSVFKTDAFNHSAIPPSV